MNSQFTSGFYTALGTPLTDEGTINSMSFCKHIEDQINADASGLLIMGSMGIEAYIRNTEYPRVARTGAAQVKGRCPVMVGVMDTSISRVLDRISSLEGLPIDGVVATVPYYNTLTQPEIISFYSKIAKASPFPVYIYDLAAITKTKITIETACTIRDTIPNVRGIKSGDLALARTMNRTSNSDFAIMYSSLDTFDIAYRGGVTKELDGMFACTAPLASKLFSALAAEDTNSSASSFLDAIIRIRNIFIQVGVLPGFTAAMNLLGYDGIFHPDYCTPLDGSEVELIRQALKDEGLL